MSSRWFAVSLAAAAALLAAGCGDGPGQPQPRRPELRLVTGQAVQDTATAVLPIIVEVIGQDGAPRPGAQVHFRAPPDPRPLWLAGTPGGFGVAALEVTTDGAGRAGAWVRLGLTPGTHAVEVEVPALQLRATASYEILPGAAARLELLPADTAVYAAGAFALRVRTTDRHGTTLPVSVAYEADGTVVTVSSGIVTARLTGRGWVIARSGALADTSRVSVLPRARLVARAGAGPGRSQLVGLDLDGSNVQPLAPWATALYSPDPVGWSADRRRGVVGDEPTINGGAEELVLLDFERQTTTRLPRNPATYGHHYPEFSPDGSWIYYAAQVAGLTWGVWRVRPDGTGHEELWPAVWTYTFPRPVPHPDGIRLLFSDGDVMGGPLRVLDVRTREMTVLPLRGRGPRWSPDGTRIAYVSTEGRLMIADADGGDPRAVPHASPWYGSYLRWSPDGKWLLAEADQQMDLVHVSESIRIPLGHLEGYGNLDWIP